MVVGPRPITWPQYQPLTSFALCALETKGQSGGETGASSFGFRETAAFGQ
jgi:hypothetical protein